MGGGEGVKSVTYYLNGPNGWVVVNLFWFNFYGRRSTTFCWREIIRLTTFGFNRDPQTWNILRYTFISLYISSLKTNSLSLSLYLTLYLFLKTNFLSPFFEKKSLSLTFCISLDLSLKTNSQSPFFENKLYLTLSLFLKSNSLFHSISLFFIPFIGFLSLQASVKLYSFVTHFLL